MTDQAPTADATDDDSLVFEDVPDPGGPVLGVVAAAMPVVLGGIGIVLSWQLGVGKLSDPGPGLWPLIVAASMVAIGLALLATATRDTSTERFTAGTTGVLIGALSLVGYALLFERTGFEVATVLLAVVWLKVVGAESWRSTVLVALLSTAVLHVIFVELLSVNLPRLI